MNYDTYGRVSTITGSNHLYNNINAESITTTYDFADNVMTENRTHKPSVGEQQIINKRWTYDVSGRVKDHFTSLNGTETKISSLNYNFRDEMSEKNLGAATASGINTYLQSLDYSYNDQGWLTKINQSTLGGTNIAFPTICTPAMPNPGVYTPAADPDPNDLFSVGIGGRMKISKRTSLNVEYYYQLPDYKLPGTTNSLAIGFDIETGGHVFQLYCTNSTGMTERTYINETTGNFFKGDIRLGFTISRVFTVKKPKS